MLKRENNFVNFSSDPRIDQGNAHKNATGSLPEILPEVAFIEYSDVI